MHNVIAHDHDSPSSFRAQARQSILARYKGIEFKDLKVEGVRKLEEGFEVSDEKGDVWRGRKLVLAVGVKDEMLEIEGYEALWGTRIFHCLFCHGYEERGAKSACLLAVPDLAAPGMVMHVARMARRLVGSVTVYTNGDGKLGEEVLKMSGKSGVKIENRKVERLEKGEGESEVVVVLEGGVKVSEGFMVC